jgi:hypothetical protein
MAVNRVNLSVDREVWNEFKDLVPARQKSKVVTDLLKNEVNKRKRQKRLEALEHGFKEAAKDRQRWAEAAEWDATDIEGWPE